MSIENMRNKIMTFYSRAMNEISKRPNVKAIGVLTFWMIGSRVLGAIRTLLIGQLPTVEADMFNAAFILPDNIIAVFVLGSITLATLPHIIELTEQVSETSQSNLSIDSKSKHVNSYISSVLLIFGVFIFILSLVCLIFFEDIFLILNPNLLNDFETLGRRGEFIAISQILLAAPLIFGIKTLFGSLLNAYKQYNIYAIDGVVTNLGILFGLIYLYMQFGLIGAVWGVLLGFFISTIFFIFDSVRLGYRFTLRPFNELKSLLLSTYHLYYPRLLIIPTLRITETIVVLTTMEANGNITALRTALDFQGIPLGIISITSTVFLPDIASIYYKSGTGEEFWNFINKYVRFNSFLSIFSGIGIVVSLPILFYILNWLNLIPNDSFFASQENTNLIVLCTAICASTLIFQSMFEVYQRVFVAVKNVKAPVITSIASNLSHIIITLIFVPTLGSAVASAVGFAGAGIISSVLSGLFSKNIT